MKENIWEKIGRFLMNDYKPEEDEIYEYKYFTLIVKKRIESAGYKK